jgi:hypothetical protein
MQRASAAVSVPVRDLVMRRAPETACQLASLAGRAAAFTSVKRAG